jgi:hypothetical protein
MLRAVQRLIAWLNQADTAAEEYQRRHQAWDRECRARGMTAREQAEELQIRCAWVRLRSKASAAALHRPARYREILDRVAADEARTLTAIGGDGLADVFLGAYEAANPREILSPEAASAVLDRSRGRIASTLSAPPLVPDLPPVGFDQTARSARSRQKLRARSP